MKQTDDQRAAAAPAEESPAPAPTQRKRAPAKTKATRSSGAAKSKAATSPTETPPNKGGRPEYQPIETDRRKVKLMAAMGIPLHDVSKVIGVSEPTLRKYFPVEIEAGHIEANTQVAGALFRAATDKTKPNVTAQIFWLKVRAGWREDRGLPLVPPAEQPPKEAPLGKKEEANLRALTAERGTDWEDLLGTPITSMQ